jgi:hypothetical protein
MNNPCFITFGVNDTDDDGGMYGESDILICKYLISRITEIYFKFSSLSISIESFFNMILFDEIP